MLFMPIDTILLVTSKPPGMAHAYAVYITTAVRSLKLFQHIYMHTDQFYNFLVYLDPANVGGIIWLIPGGIMHGNAMECPTVSATVCPK